MAKDRGFFAKYNIDAEITQFTGGPELADATMAGEMDFGSSGTATWMPRFVRSDALLIVSTMATSTDNFKMAASTSIRTLPEVQGKKLGTVGGSTIDYLWALVAQKLNIAEFALNLLAVTPPELPVALDRGDVQAFFSWEPGPRGRSRYRARIKSTFLRAAVMSATSKASSLWEISALFRRSRRLRSGCSPPCATPVIL